MKIKPTILRIFLSVSFILPGFSQLITAQSPAPGKQSNVAYSDPQCDELKKIIDNSANNFKNVRISTGDIFLPGFTTKLKYLDFQNPEITVHDNLFIETDIAATYEASKIFPKSEAAKHQYFTALTNIKICLSGAAEEQSSASVIPRYNKFSLNDKVNNSKVTVLLSLSQDLNKAYRLDFKVFRDKPTAAVTAVKIGNSGQNNVPNASRIVAGKGWDKIIVGATQAQIENVLGKPEKFYEGNLLLPDPSGFYFSRGIIVVYDAQTNLVKSIDFIGNPAYLDAESYAETFRSVSAKPDKNIEWNANPSQIIAVYGEPKHKLNQRKNNADVVTLTYDQITFVFNSNKLYYITVVRNNDRFLAAMKKQAEEKPLKEKYAAELGVAAQPISYTSQFKIIPGKGTDKIYLGVSRANIEAAFGQPDEFIDEEAGIFRIYEAHYFSKGVQIEYDPKTKIATSILFFGDTAKTKAFGKFKLFPGVTDKEIRWGVSPADVMRAYGKPVEERMRYNPKIDKDWEFITYPNVAFGFAENRLVYIANDKIWGKQ
jgi:hypothetical protein